MQNVGQSENRNIDKVNVQLDVVKSSTPQSSSSSPAKSETETYSAPAQYMSDSSESEDDSVSEAEMDEEAASVETANLLLSSDDPDRSVDPEMQARLEALLEAAGIGKIAGEGKHLADPEVLRRLTSSVSNALDEAAAALTRMRSDQPPTTHHRHHTHQDKPTQCGSTATGTTGASVPTCTSESAPSLAEACSDGDVGTVRKLLTEGRSVHETTEEGESLLSLACSAGYYELAQVLLAMHASVEDRGIKGDCTPLMEAASAGHVDIVRLLIAHGADVNTVSGSGNTPLMYACAGGHEECVRALLDHGANVEEHNENGHTPLMEAASAGHVGVAKILLEHGAGINTHSNEFKESALTLACYKGHLDMVRFLLAAGADREHKTDEMHTALMEASMDGHVEVARLLLDSGAQVNMPTDSFESPLTLAACGGHVELAMLLLERGANIEEVNDEGYTPLMEAAREGHEEMVALLLSQGAMINAQTEETQETALTLACCGGFLEVADFLIKAGADLELGASTPLMEASQEGHLDLVRYLINAGCDVHAQTQTGDTALTYACENGHTDVAELLLRAGAPLEHESEGGRTPLMKACRAGHLCTVQFLHQKGADVNRMTANGDHTPLSLACAGGHADVVKFLLACDADPFRKLKDNSSTLIEAAKGGHTAVVQLLLDYPHSVMLQRNHTHHHPVTPAPVEDPAGLTPAQAAQLGLCVVGGPETGGRTVVPATEERGRCGGCHYKHRKPHKHTDQHEHTPDQIRIVDLRENIREKLSKISPPPGFTWEMAGISVKRNKNSRLEAILAQARNKPLPDDRTLLELTETTGPPTLATSALHALDLQFCAQGVTTTPTTPPYPPPQPFPAQTLAATVNQVQLQQMQQSADPQLVPANRTEHLQGHSAPTQQTQTVPSSEELGGSEARELSAVLAYLQREVPSLVALPPTELRSLVLQVMQQKSHEILSGAMGGAGGSEESPARRLLAAAEHALTHHHHLDHNHHSSGTCGYARRSASPSPDGATPPPPAHTHTHTNHNTNATATGNANVNVNANANANANNVNTKRVGVGGVVPAPPPPVYGAAPLPKKKGKRGGARRGGGDTGPGALDVDNETDSNHDTALTLACAGGHDDLVDLLLARGADIEHRDKKGFTPLILAATAGHEKIVEILLNHGADIEAQSERTKDTPLSLACSGGRYEVVELILSRGANKEHRNVSDYTPLSLAASGGYVNIIRLLLHHQAEINSRTGSKLGISPLMLAAMNGHTAAVRLLLDCGSDINAQIETNRNTALTLACFQGRHEVVSLLLDRKANVEHRAKTGLTPLMEAASGGYVEVGRVLLDKGADVNAPPVPSSRDTALTIAADKGHTKFVELLLQRRAAVEVKNKKGNSPLWLAAHGGHLAVVEMLYAAGADIDSQDNRKVSCLMAAFRKGHTKVVKWMVGVVTQFPSDQEMTRYIWTISDKELLEKCQECVRTIRAAKETQAARANQNATILLEELDAERSREQSRRLAAARRREKKKKKKIEKKEERRKLQSVDEPESVCLVEESEGGEHDDEPPHKEEGDSGIDANSQGSCSSSDVKAPPAPAPKSKKKKKDDKPTPPPPPTTTKKQTDKSKQKPEATKPEKEPPKPDKKQEKENVAPTEPPPAPKPQPVERRPVEKKDKKPEEEIKSITIQNVNKFGNNSRKTQVFESTRHMQDDYDVDKTKKPINFYSQWEEGKSTSPKSANAPVRREEGWKEVVRKSSVQTISTVEPGCKRVSVASHAISRVIGRAGSNINAIRSATGAHIEVDKQTKGQGERIITIKGSPEATKQAANLIAAMIRDPEADIAQLLPRKVPAPAPIPVVAKPLKQPAPKVSIGTVSVVRPAVRPSPSKVSVTRPLTNRITAPAMPPSPSTAEKRVTSSSPSLVGVVGTSAKVSYAVVGGRGGTFANKVTNTHTPAPPEPRVPAMTAEVPSSPVKERTEEEPRTPHRPASLNVQLSPESTSSWSTNEENVPSSTALHINTNPQTSTSSSGGTQEYSLFKDAGGGVWGDSHHHAESHAPQVDVSKAPGYRGGCSPSSRASSHSATPPPPAPIAPPPHTHGGHSNTHHPHGSTVNTMDMSGLNRNGPIYQDNSRNGHNMMQQVSMSSGVGLGLGYVGVESRLNPRAPDFSQRPPLIQHKHNAQLFGATSPSPGASSANLSTLLMQYQPKPVPPPPMTHLPYPSLLDRSMGGVTGTGGTWDEEDRKPRPIGTERAWKMTTPDDWHLPHVNHHLMQDHDRYQQMNGPMVGGPPMVGSEYGGAVSGVGGVGGTGATAAALSLMQALPLYHLPPNHDHQWDQPHPHNDNQSWSKWTH